MLAMSGLLSLFVFELVLLSPLRWTWLERRGIGIVRLFCFHHYMAIAFCLFVAWHMGAFLTLDFSSSWNPSTLLSRAPWLWSDRLSASGLIAYLLFLITVAASWLPLGARGLWIGLHRVGVAGIPLLIIHLIDAWSGRMTVGGMLGWGVRWGLLVGGMICLAAVVLHFFYPQALSTSRTFFVDKVDHLNDEVTFITLRLSPGRGSWVSGSFGFFRFKCRGGCNVSPRWHPFTVVDCSEPDRIQLVVKRLGEDTKSLQAIEVGARGVVTGPYGEFVKLPLRPDPQLWLAGGLGILPFLGLINSLRRHQKDVIDADVVYFYAAATGPTFLDELHRSAQKIRGLRVHAVAQGDGCNVNVAVLRSLVPDIKDRLIAVAGPHAMVETWISMLRKAGLRRTMREDFTR